MAQIRITLLFVLVFLSACSSHPRFANGNLRYAPACPAGTVKICETDSLRGCGCGEFIVLN